MKKISQNQRSFLIKYLSYCNHILNGQRENEDMWVLDIIWVYKTLAIYLK